MMMVMMLLLMMIMMMMTLIVARLSVNSVDVQSVFEKIYENGTSFFNTLLFSFSNQLTAQK